MRYYEVTLSNDSGQVWTPNSQGGLSLGGTTGSTFTSFPMSVNATTFITSQQTDPGALNFEIDAPISAYHAPQGSAWVRIWGVGLKMLSQASNLNGANIKVKAGMQAGLPLANPKQAGLILQGQVFQAFGNWQGVDQTLELMIIAGGLEPDDGFTLNWQDGQELQDALSECLSPLTQADGGTPAPYTLGTPQIQSTVGVGQCASWFPKLSDVANFVQQRTVDPDSNYPGVQIAISGSTIGIFDYTVTPDTITQLQFQDFVGQPTWISATQISFKMVMRADLTIGSQVKFPAGIKAPFALTSQGAAQPNTPASSNLTFQGSFNITEAHFFGNLRQPDAESWVVAFVAVPVSATDSGSAS